MKYDDASWHYEGEFPETSPHEWGGVHMGVFLRLMFMNGMAGEIHLEESPDAVSDVISGTSTGTKFLFEQMDGKMTDEDFSEAGNVFAQAYFGNEEGPFGQFLIDLQEVGNFDTYAAPEESVNMAAMEDIFEFRLANFLATGDVMKEPN